MIRRIDTVEQIREFVMDCRVVGKTVGVVPTMGALHDGHLSLAKRSTCDCDVTIATIFVNPTQFAEGEDLDQYPRTLDADCDRLQSLGVDAVFVPSVDEMYPSGASTLVQPPTVARRWEGQFRPTHFQGVTTIVLKLFHAVPATDAFFGRKDYQQLQVIKTMVRDLNIGIKIVGCETVRESDGLAMSSRNRYLSAEERRRALAISRSLKSIADKTASGQSDVNALEDQLQAGLRPDESSGGVDTIDYAVIVDPETLEPVSVVDRPVIALVAAHVGQTRLIDNRLISP